MKMLITGVSGLLGNNLAHYFKNKYEILGLYHSHSVTIPGIKTEKINLLDFLHTKKIINEFNPSFIIHCASLANVDYCEKHPKESKKVNVLLTENIVNITSQLDTKLVYISSDSVYDGSKGDFSETNKINPLNIYGRSKYQGELEVLKNNNSLILRTNLFGWNIQDKESLGEWILNKLRKGEQIKGFKNAFFSTIYTFELARVIDIAIQNNSHGIYNCGSSDTCSKYEFALKIANRFGLDIKLVEPISLEDCHFKAKRGKNLSLNSTKIQKALLYKLPTTDQTIDEFYKDFRCGVPQVIKKMKPDNDSKSIKIPYGRQCIDENDIQAVISVLKSDRLTQGPKVEEFADEIKKYCGAKYAVAVNSGTSALHIASLSAGIKRGDEVITSPNTFVASANCIVYCNANPVFADIDMLSYNISPREIEAKITERTKAIIPVHFAGQSCDMDSINQVVKSTEKKYGHKIYIIEDASHALGSIYKNKKIGSCFFSDMTVMSFHPVKHITTGEGGIILTNDQRLYTKLMRFRSHGITSTPEELVYKELAFEKERDSDKLLLNPWYYEQQELGYNYRITDIQCALGLSQLKKLEKFRSRRREIVNIYNKAFNSIGTIQTPFESSDCDSNFHLYVLLINFRQIGFSRARLMYELRKRNIQTQVHYIPVHLQPFYQKNYETQWGDYPRAEKYYQSCLSFPLYAVMSDDEVKKVIHEVQSLSRNSK